MTLRKFSSTFITILLCCSSAQAKVKNISNGVQLEQPTFNVSVQFYSNSTVRIQKWLPGTKPDTSSLVVIQKTLPQLQINTQDLNHEVIVSTDQLKVYISKDDGHMSYQSTTGAPLLKEKSAAELIPSNLEKAYSIKQTFELTADEGIYGLGQHQNGLMNYRGEQVKLVQTNTDAVTPFLISTQNYGILWDNYSKTIFTDNAEGMSLWSEVADHLDYYFIAGQNMDSVISGYRILTGKAPMYGKWAYGYWQSKEHYENRDELLDVASEYRKRKIPIDNIIQDWDTWEGNENWSQLFFDEKKFPQPKEMLDILHKQNYHVMISIWCSFGKNTPVYKEMDRKGFLLAPVGWAKFKYFDVYNPAANSVYWHHINKGLFSIGLDAWWMDSTEPDIINANTKESTEYEMKRVPNNHKGSFAKYLNPYSLMATEAVYQNQRKVTDQKRVYILTRSTFAGQQRAAATTWSGDIGASWEVYRKQITAGINHSMAGIPYWTFDIGAFVLGSYGGVFHKGGTDPAYQELYTRMFQFGAFCPIFRSHGSETPREIWKFGDFSNSLIKFDNLRYRLMPYIYSQAYQITQNNYTLLRGLAMDFPKDKKTYGIKDQFMFGPSIMVCPVTEFMLHRPPLSTVPVAGKYFKTLDGKPGLQAKYYKTDNHQGPSTDKIDSCVNVNWYATGRPDYVTDSTLSIDWNGVLIPSETGKHQFHIKCYSPKKIKINDKELAFTYKSVEVYTETIELKAGESYRFSMEVENSGPGAMHAELFWKTPSMFEAENKQELAAQNRMVYLPQGTAWIDFWTGKKVAGGTSLKSDAPIDKIPLFVKEGAIVSMGPFVQNATEKATDTLEIRIYTGADGKFTLYEDENDNYNYEKGVFATIDFSWNQKLRALTISERKGTFPGMLSQRLFNIVLVDENKGSGLEISKKWDKSIVYKGTKQVIKF